MAQNLIFNILAGKNDLNNEIKKSAKSALTLSQLLAGKSSVEEQFNKGSNAAKLLSKSISGVAGSVLNLKTAAAVGFGAFVLSKIINEPKQLENSLIGLRSVASATGNDVGFIEEQAKSLASDGLIPLTNVSNSLKNLLATGLDGQKAVEVFKALRDSAAFNRQGQLELGEAIEGASEGLKNDLSIKIDNAGITKNLSNIQKEYAASIGKTIGSLTEQEKVQAKYFGILKESRIFQGDYNKLLETYSGATSEASGRTRFLLAELGGIITNSPNVIEGIGGISDIIKTLTDIVKENGPQLSNFVGGIADFLLVTPSKFWNDFLIDGAKSASGVKAITDEMAKLEAEAGKIQERLQANKDNSLYNSFIGKRSDDIKAFAEVTDRIRILQEQLDSFNKSKELQQADQLQVKAEDDARVQREIKAQEIINQLRLEQAEKEKELEEIKQEEELAKNEERLALIQSQLEAENEIKRIAAEQEAAQRAKTLKDLEKVEADGNLRRLKNEETLLKRQVKLQEDTTKAKIEVAQAGVDLAEALSKQGNKAVFLAQKSLAAAQVIITGIAAESAAVAPPPIGAGPIAGAGLAALIRAKTVLNLATIAATTVKGFQSGGLLADGTRSGDSVVFRGNREEAVFTRAQQAELFSIANGRGGTQISEQSAPTIIEVPVILNGREIARAVRDERSRGVAV